MSQAASNTSDPRMQALAAASTALAAVNAAQALQAGQGQTINGKSNQIVTATDAQGNPTATKDAIAADKLGGITVSVSLGSSKSQSHSTQTADQAKGSSIAAGGDVRVIGQGAGKESDILIQGSKVSAGGAVVLQAEDQLTLQAAANTAIQKSSNSSQSMSVGVGFELGAKGGAGVTVAGSLGRGKANGQDLSWDETKINAGREVALTSGSDTQLNGAIVTAPKVSAEVGGDLTIVSLQDTSTYRNQQQSVGGSITFGPKVTGSVNFANSNIKSDYASVDQQAGIRAGDNGFKVNVQGDTTLTGGAITSTDKAVKENKNSFTTGGQLTTSDINNQANYQADSVGVNIGVGVSPLGKYVPGGTSAGIGSDSGKSSSTTRAGISDIAGDITARTDTNQANTSVALAKIFDANKVQKEINAQVAITQAFGQLTSGLNETTPIKDKFGKVPNNSDLEQHLSVGGPSASTRGVSGAHSDNAFKNELASINGQIIGTPEEIAPGIKVYQYNTPERIAKNVNPLTKTTYDSTYTDNQILEMSKRASSQAWTEIQRTGITPGQPVNTTIDGVPFRVLIERDSITKKPKLIYSHPGFE